MTYRELTKHLGRMTADQLDQNIIVEVGDNFHNVVGVNTASGKGDYLYKNEVFFSTDETPLSEKDFDEECEEEED